MSDWEETEEARLTTSKKDRQRSKAAGAEAQVDADGVPTRHVSLRPRSVRQSIASSSAAPLPTRAPSAEAAKADAAKEAEAPSAKQPSGDEPAVALPPPTAPPPAPAFLPPLPQVTGASLSPYVVWLQLLLLS